MMSRGPMKIKRELAQHRSRHCRGRRGLSLLEVLISLAIFLFALVGIGRLIILLVGRDIDDCQRRL